MVAGRDGDLTPAEREAVAAIDLDGLVDLLCRLIAVPSLDGTEAENAAQRAVADWMDAAGLDSDVWPIDLTELRRHPDYSAEVERRAALGVVGWVGESAGLVGAEPAGRDLLLNGHVDVVPPGDEGAWTVSPWRGTVRDGCVYGRGSVDMKGGLCCALYAAKALRDAGVALRGRLVVASVVGEEDGGTGTLAMLRRGHTAQGAIVAEPTALRVVPAQAGSLMFRLTVKGRAAHGCVREEGVSAIERFVPILAALRALEARRCGVAADSASGGSGLPAAAGDPADALFAGYRLPWPIEIGTLRAGEWASSVPERLVAEGRFGVAVGEDPAEARQTLEEAVRRAAASDSWLVANPPQVEWWGGRFAPVLTDVGHPLVRTLAGAARAVGGVSPDVEGVTYGSDLRLLVNLGGIPGVLFGPGDVRDAHAVDERVPIQDLRVAAQTYAVAAMRFCGCKD